jgi:hypothetical protein
MKQAFRLVLRTLLGGSGPATTCAGLPADVRAFLRRSYPSNHCYWLAHGRLRPTRQLAARYRALSRLYPAQLTSLLDLSCCKGYFVLEGAQRATCDRALGIDVGEKYLRSCRLVQEALGASGAQFARLHLHELAERIQQFGGPFQTVLLVNTYQYLFFGSRGCGQAYLDHRRIFRLIREVCAERLIFNNRTELADCHADVQAAADRCGEHPSYSTATILAAAREYFDVEMLGDLGRYPLWLLRARLSQDHFDPRGACLRNTRTE